MTRVSKEKLKLCPLKETHTQIVGRMLWLIEPIQSWISHQIKHHLLTYITEFTIASLIRSTLPHLGIQSRILKELMVGSLYALYYCTKHYSMVSVGMSVMSRPLLFIGGIGWSGLMKWMGK